MFPHTPPRGDAHWVYDDPSGLPEPAARAAVAKPQAQKPRGGRLIAFPFPKPAAPKAA